jgi:hypothetical protein
MLLRACMHIKESLNFDIQLIEKSLVPTEKDWALYWGEKSLKKLQMSSDDDARFYLLQRAGQVGALKRKDDYIMERHHSIPGVYRNTETSTDFINRVLSPYLFFVGTNMKKFVEWFSLKRSSDVRASDTQ